jgi:hypothetical protein
MPPRKLNIIFDTTVKITETEYIKMLHEIQSLKELTTQQALELQEYKTFFEKFKNLLDKQ